MRAGRLLSILMPLQVHRRLTARDLAGRGVGGGWWRRWKTSRVPTAYPASAGRKSWIRRCRRPYEFDLAAYWEHSASEFREKLPRYYATFLAEEPVMRWVRYRGWRLEEETAAPSK